MGQQGQNRERLQGEVHVIQVAAGKSATKNTIGQPNSESIPLANWRKLLSSIENEPRQDGQTTHRPQISAGILNRPTCSYGAIFLLKLPAFVPDGVR